MTMLNFIIFIHNGICFFVFFGCNLTLMGSCNNCDNNDNKKEKLDKIEGDIKKNIMIQQYLLKELYM